MKQFSIVAAMDSNRGIGKDNKLPWRLKGDMEFFKCLTTYVDLPGVLNRFFYGKDGVTSNAIPTISGNTNGEINAVIMGRKTWESIPLKFRPLPDRFNIVLSKTQTDIKGAVVFDSLDIALTKLETYNALKNVFVIGGAQVYAEALRHSHCKNVFLTEINGTFACDTFFPDIKEFYRVLTESAVINEKDIPYKFRMFEKL